MLKNKKGTNLNIDHKNNISTGLNNYFKSKYEAFYNNPNNNIRDPRTTLVGEYNTEDKLIKLYPSVAEASRSIGIAAHHMGKIIRRKNNKYNNSIWKYYNEKNLKTNEESISVEE